jgi:hypothetical protein
MARRVTVMIDEDNLKKLRILQAKLLRETNSSVSFSKVLNDVVSKCFKKNE